VLFEEKYEKNPLTIAEPSPALYVYFGYEIQILALGPASLALLTGCNELLSAFACCEWLLSTRSSRSASIEIGRKRSLALASDLNVAVKNG
jgi:hypothetical protein